MIELEQEERYIQNAKDILKMLEDHPEFVPNMRAFCNVSSYEVYSTEHPCGTSYCLAGYQAYLDNYPVQYITEFHSFDYLSYSQDKCGYDSLDDFWDFIYGEFWPDTRESAIARCQYIIDHYGGIPEREDWENMELNDAT